MTPSEQKLKEVLAQNPQLMKVLERASELGIRDWYVGAGGIAQTFWNHAHGFDPMHEIKDLDLVYWDPDMSEEAQKMFIRRGEELFKDVAVPVEIVNQARVHLWYSDRPGNNRWTTPHVSTEDAIDHWPTTATAVGVRIEPDGSWKFYAPFGLDDLMNLVVRPNKVKISQAIYDRKTERWKQAWPRLEVAAW